MTDSPQDELTFEKALAELEQIVHDLEDGEIGLEGALGRYEKGVNLIKRCYGQLRQAEQRIQLVTGIDAEEQPILKPFDHAATADSEKSAAVRRVRKKPDDEVPF